jgi:hypothetical protein
MNAPTRIVETYRIIEEHVSKFGPVRSLIEFGPGDYVLYNELSKYSLNYTVVDITEPPKSLTGMISYHKKNIDELISEVVNGNSSGLGQFDVVVANEVIEHFDFPIGFFSLMASLMSDKSTLIITTPNIYNLINVLSFIRLRDDVFNYSNLIVTKHNFFKHSHVLHFSAESLARTASKIFNQVNVTHIGGSNSRFRRLIKIITKLIPSLCPQLLLVCRSPLQLVSLVSCIRNGFVVPYLPNHGCLHRSIEDKKCITCIYFHPKTKTNLNGL